MKLCGKCLIIKSILRIVGINFGLIVSVIVLVEVIFGSWIFGPDYGVLNIPRNEIRHFDVSEFIEPGKVITYTRDRYGFRGGYDGEPSKGHLEQCSIPVMVD